MMLINSWIHTKSVELSDVDVGTGLEINGLLDGCYVSSG